MRAHEHRPAAHRLATGPTPTFLVVSAFPPELAPLRRLLRRPELGAWVRDGRLACQAVGIGLVDAAIGTTRLLDAAAAGGSASPTGGLLFVGTAGSYGADLAPGAVVIVDEVVLVSTAVARGQGYLPDRIPTRIAASRRLGSGLLEAARRLTPAPGLAVRAAVANPLAITRHAGLGRALARATAAAAENLEVFAVARAAEARRIPFAAVLGIANRVGPAAHAEWQEHNATASAAACAAVAEFLRARTRAPS
jgi:nucleoside phosphorylase